MTDQTYSIGHRCDCGEEAESFPELDASSIPHAIRHGSVLGALGQVQPGQGMILKAPHNPLPLLAQIEQVYPGRFASRYLTEGPEAWRIAFVREGQA